MVMFCVTCKRYSGENPKGIWYWCCMKCDATKIMPSQTALIHSTLGNPISLK